MTEKTLGADAAVVEGAGSSAPDQLTHADRIYGDARAFCYGVAGEAVAPYTDFSHRERLIIDRCAEWMGSRDCQIERLTRALKDVERHHVMLNGGIGRNEERSTTLRIVRDAIAKAGGRS